MTEEQKTLVRNTFAAISPDASFVAAMFYRRLFDIDPNLRRLFSHDMAEQGRKLIAMIGTAVANLDHLDTIIPAVRDLGVRHAGYGVVAADYATVGSALLWTLEQGLGEAFTREVREAWTVCYGTLAAVMQDAAAAAG